MTIRQATLIKLQTSFPAYVVTAAEENNLIKYLEILKVTDAKKSEYLHLLEGASSTNMTRQISGIDTIKMPYGGKSKMFFIFILVISLVVAIFCALIKNLIETERKRSRGSNL